MNKPNSDINHHIPLNINNGFKSILINFDNFLTKKKYEWSSEYKLLSREFLNYNVEK